MKSMRQVACRRRRACASGRGRFDRDDLKRVHRTVFAADRDVFAGTENVRTEAAAALVVLSCVGVVIEEPASDLGPVRVVYHLPDLILLACPEAAHAAMRAVPLPLLAIDMAIRRERRNEFIAVPRRALRKLLRAGEIEPDALEIVR